MTGIFNNHQITHRCHLLLYSNVLVIQFQYNTHRTKCQCFLCIVYITYILFLRLLEPLHNRLLGRTKESAKIVHFFKKNPPTEVGGLDAYSMMDWFEQADYAHSRSTTRTRPPQASLTMARTLFSPSTKRLRRPSLPIK